MVLELTPEERNALIWQEGDQLVVYAGTYQVVKVSEWRFNGPRKDPAPLLTYITFIFESSLGPIELKICGANCVPNGPALLIANERNGKLCAWGVVSVVNGAWMHAWPPEENMHYRQTKRMATMLEKSIGGGLVALAFRSKIQSYVSLKSDDGMIYLPPSSELQQMESMARQLIYRVSKDVQQYWDDGGNSTSGRL